VNHTRVLHLRKYVIVAALVFWLPDILVHALRGNRFGGIDILGLTVLLPVLTCMIVARIWRKSGDIGKFLPADWSAVPGIWLCGPLLMTVGFSFDGGGFAKPGGWQLAVLGTGLFPFFTFEMSTYDGTLFAVILATALLPLMSLFLKHQPRASPLPSSK
jgi:hypothetical protein